MLNGLLQIMFTLTASTSRHNYLIKEVVSKPCVPAQGDVQLDSFSWVYVPSSMTCCPWPAAKKLKASEAGPPSPLRVSNQRPVAGVSRQAYFSTNDKW